MPKVDFSQIWPELIGLVPVYARDGTNGTRILLEHRQAIFSDLKTKTLLAQLARTFLFDLQAARRAFGRVCGRCYAIPVAIRPGLVLLPVRARQARVKDDGTRAYIVKAKIRSIRPEYRGLRKTGTRFSFCDGSSLVVPHRWSSVREILLAADLVEKEAAGLGGYPSGGSGGPTPFRARESRPDYCYRNCPQSGLCRPPDGEED